MQILGQVCGCSTFFTNGTFSFSRLFPLIKRLPLKSILIWTEWVIVYFWIQSPACKLLWPTPLRQEGRAFLQLYVTVISIICFSLLPGGDENQSVGGQTSGGAAQDAAETWFRRPKSKTFQKRPKVLSKIKYEKPVQMSFIWLKESQVSLSIWKGVFASGYAIKKGLKMSWHNLYCNKNIYICSASTFPEAFKGLRQLVEIAVSLCVFIFPSWSLSV